MSINHSRKIILVSFAIFFSCHPSLANDNKCSDTQAKFQTNVHRSLNNNGYYASKLFMWLIPYDPLTRKEIYMGPTFENLVFKKKIFMSDPRYTCTYVKKEEYFYLDVDWICKDNKSGASYDTKFSTTYDGNWKSIDLLSKNGEKVLVKSTHYPAPRYDYYACKQKRKYLHRLDIISRVTRSGDLEYLPYLLAREIVFENYITEVYYPEDTPQF